MEKNEIVIKDSISVKEFCRLREAVGFQRLTEEQAQKVLEHTPLLINAVYREQSIGLVRVLTDFVTDAYLTDVIVAPDYQGEGIGKMLVQQAISRLKDKLEDGIILACNLYANPGKENFYERFGFTKLPAGKYGYGMLREI